MSLPRGATPAAAAAAIFVPNLIFCIPTRYFLFQPLRPLQPLFFFPTLYLLFQPHFIDTLYLFFQPYIFYSNWLGAPLFI